MIAKGNQRSGGAQLATHLLNAHDNERVEVLEVRGSIANDLHGAFAEWSGQARATQCTKYLYSLSVNPDQRQGHLSRAQYLDFLERVEKRLGLEGQGRAVVFHAKPDKAGIPREHCHAVWSRIDATTSRAVNIAFDRQKLREVAKDFALSHGLELPKGMQQDRGLARHDRRASHADLQEKQQEERTGLSKEERVAMLTKTWQATVDGPAFVSAMQRQGFVLARGDTRAYVVVDRGGDVHSLVRQLEGVKAAALKARLVSSHPIETLPSVDEAKAQSADRHATLEALRPAMPPAGPTPDDRRAVLKEQQEIRRAAFNVQRDALSERHGREGKVLEAMHEQAHAGISTERIARQPRGFAGFLSRVTGLRALSAHFQQRQDRITEDRHKAQKTALDRRHSVERRDMDRQDRNLSAIETRETRSLETKLKREDFQKLAQLVQSKERLVETFKAQSRTPPTPQIPSETQPSRDSQRERLQQLFMTQAGSLPSPATPAAPTESKSVARNEFAAQAQPDAPAPAKAEDGPDAEREAERARELEALKRKKLDLDFEI